VPAAPTLSSERARSRGAFDASSAWWLVVLLGVLSLVAGVILVLKPSNSLATLCVIFGIFLLVDGIAAVVSSFQREEGAALFAVIGVLGIIVGILLIRHPTHAVNLIGLIIGIWLVAAGAVRLVQAVVERRRLVLRLALAVLEIAIGIAVVSNPHIGYATLAILIGIWLILNGLGVILVGIALRAVGAD
jgi:uncharacterized membrane protein HdeD (DUF308 family)